MEVLERKIGSNNREILWYTVARLPGPIFPVEWYVLVTIIEGAFRGVRRSIETFNVVKVWVKHIIWWLVCRKSNINVELTNSTWGWEPELAGEIGGLNMQLMVMSWWQAISDSVQYFNYPSINTTNIIKKRQYLVVNRATCFGYFLAIFRPNKEPEFRYIKCAPNGIH